MNTAEAALAQALRERLRIIGDEKSRRDPDGHMEQLRGISARIEELSAALPQPVDARLAHFLQRRSYEKALALLEQPSDGRASAGPKFINPLENGDVQKHVPPVKKP
jgi:hypothetical protein